ncbi:LysR family transcriptional regulator [Pendulispora albinea]|uniref:LysR family transcriptional regulator n=1 Tax=Pendulispora albinea TaxID=2741071 RepID=A0ABZ2M8V0_9BACT
MLDLTRLRVLAEVAKHGSVTAAAQALHYAQPSVSHHLARLEEETGAKLVQRVGRGIRLTDAGRMLAERAAEILGRLGAAEAELSAHTGLRQGRVRLAAFPSALGTFVPKAAALLAEKFPNLDLRLREAEPPEALQQLRAGEIDVAVVFAHEFAADNGLPPPPDDDGVRLTHLLTEPVHLVVPKGKRRRKNLAAYADERWIAGCDRCRRHLLAQCARAGFTPKIAFTTDDYVAVQALVAADLGVTTLPELALLSVRHAGIVALPLPGAVRSVLAATYGQPPDPPATAALLDALSRSVPRQGLTRGARAPA